MWVTLQADWDERLKTGGTELVSPETDAAATRDRHPAIYVTPYLIRPGLYESDRSDSILMR
jgi:hypothetical protein